MTKPVHAQGIPKSRPPFLFYKLVYIRHSTSQYAHVTLLLHCKQVLSEQGSSSHVMENGTLKPPSVIRRLNVDPLEFLVPIVCASWSGYGVKTLLSLGTDLFPLFPRDVPLTEARLESIAHHSNSMNNYQSFLRLLRPVQCPLFRHPRSYILILIKPLRYVGLC